MSAPFDRLLCGLRAATLADESGYGLIEDAAIGIRDGRIAYIGPQTKLSAEQRHQAREIELFDNALATPALIDCHTHLVFGGNRAREFEMRLNGASYTEIAQAGGGILSTVRATREATEEQLLTAALPRARALMRDGVATIEIKSGYGLDIDTELRMLRVARRLGEVLGISVRTTLLAAHALPPEYAGRADDYIRHVCTAILPAAHNEGLVDAVDAFCEGIGFSPEQTRRVFDAATALGLPVKLHADQLSNLGGAALVADYGGLSADHIEFTDEDAVARMAERGTVAVLLPGAFLCLRETQLPPIDALRRHRVPMAVSTDLNPGTSPLMSLRLAMNLACTLFRLTPEEALRGATVNAAKALGLADRGRLVEGMRADIAVWGVTEAAELSYWMGAELLQATHYASQRHD
ncbi:imidazolonepropionase [Aquimonas voraii]|uniref:Imidazolonepropionase n=1 Tax=Aquimonas voraii TaxID=265719 RepID=A0A1G6U6X8_9GAMM|nr:imidazolonepropionase [Aquimonas voraii]SDD37069.1 imidazolonepropionase [Aquimonas voraii]